MHRTTRLSRKAVATVWLVLCWLVLTPANPQAFAQTAVCESQSGPALLTCVQSTYNLSAPQGYGPARDILYGQIDSDENNQLEGIYSGYTITLDPSDDPSQDAFSKGINAEHVFPQSLGAGDEPERSDMHNLYPCRANVNSSRSNLRFGESLDNDTDSWFYLDMQVSTVPPPSERDNYSERGFTWEPREAKKGDIARAIFYFYTIHRSVADERFFDNMRDVLLTWHENDPATQAERDRSSLIAATQGNENPFVLDATLADRLYGEGAGSGDVVAVIDENFEDGAIPDGWTTYDASGANDWTVDEYGSNRFAKMTEYQGSGTHNDWLITPQIDFDAYGDETLSFFTKTGFRDGDALRVLVSGNYSGSGDPSLATWTELSVTLSNHTGNGYADGFTGSGIVDLSTRSGTGYIAYHYVQTATADGEWQVDDVLVQASATTVPVELASFDVQADGDRGAVLQWSTASETNNAGFDILHQAPGTSQFTSAGFVAGAGTTAEARQYRFALSNLSPGTHRFRLRQVDIDGTETLTAPRSLTLARPGSVLLTGPNPVHHGQTARLTVTPSASGTLAIGLYDMLGRRVETLYRGSAVGGQPVTLRVSAVNLTSGMYLLRVTGPAISETRRVAIVR